MVKWIAKRRYSPIGVDVGSRSVKLLQLDVERCAVHEAARWDLSSNDVRDPAERDARVAEAIHRAREGRNFRGRKAVFCLGAESLFVQNIRVAQATGDELRKIVHFEAAGRLPFSSEEAEIRYLDAANVRQGDTVRREVILLACRRAVVERIVSLAGATGLRPVAIDVEPAALLRCYSKQFRRDDDQDRRVLLVNIGASNSTVVIAKGSDAMFIKYVDVGGRHLDEALANHLKIDLPEAAALRRHNGDRRTDQRDPEVTRSITESIRPVLDRLANELSLCLRYYSVTFRGQPLSQVVLGGGEATESLADWLSTRLDLPCHLGDPLRNFRPAGTPQRNPGRIGQWDVATGLALMETRK